MKTLRVALPVLLLVASIAFPLTTEAALFKPIIDPACHCDKDSGNAIDSAPDFGCVLQTTQNVVNLSVTLAVLVVTVVIAYAGILWILSPINAENRKLGRTMLLNAVIGLLIVLLAWIFIDFLMKAIYNPSATGQGVAQLGPWNQLLDKSAIAGSRCIKLTPRPAAPTTSHPGTGGVSVTPTQPNPTPGTQPTPTPGTEPTTPTVTYNAQAATDYATSNAESRSIKKCAQYVRQALAAGGFTSLNSTHPREAKDYGPTLTGLGFQPITGSVQKGDVVVFQATTGHPSGHIAIYNGSQWVSDFRQQDIDPSRTRDYTRNNTPYVIYRFPG